MFVVAMSRALEFAGGSAQGLLPPSADTS